MSELWTGGPNIGHTTLFCLFIFTFTWQISWYNATEFPQPTLKSCVRYLSPVSNIEVPCQIFKSCVRFFQSRVRFLSHVSDFQVMCQIIKSRVRLWSHVSDFEVMCQIFRFQNTFFSLWINEYPALNPVPPNVLENQWVYAFQLHSSHLQFFETLVDS